MHKLPERCAPAVLDDGRLQFVRLLNHGANVNLTDTSGRAALGGA